MRRQGQYVALSGSSFLRLALAGTALAWVACGGNPASQHDATALPDAASTDAVAPPDDATAPDAATGSCPVLETSGGPVEGEPSGETCRYLGIPYAAPPLGPLRWRPPQPPASWTVPRPSQEAPRCAQPAVAGFTPASTDEDCLYLNVWTPPAPTTSRPIMVWIHGGGFRTGAGVDPILDPAKLVTATGAIVVTLNYRLGPFGFMSNPELRAEDVAHPSAGNFGIEDQIAALEWVQQNAETLNGDAANVTIWGGSAGGTSVWVHLASSKSAGLFARAIIESGWAFHLRGVHTTAEADQEGAAFAASINCSDPSQLLACLRAASPERVVAYGSWVEMLPTVDGFVLADDPFALLAAGSFNEVPVLIGSNNDEGTYFVGTPPDTPASYEAFAERWYPGLGATIVAHYPVASFGGAYNLAAAAVVGDGLVVCPARRVARAVAAAGLPAFRYDFTHAVVDSRFPSWFGAFHGSEAYFVFGNSWQYYTMQPEELPLSALMMGYWGAMAANGDPNGAGRPVWPAYDLASETDLVLDLTPSTETAYKSAQCDFWDSLQP